MWAACPLRDLKPGGVRKPIPEDGRRATRLLGDLQRGRRRVAAPGELQAARLLGDLATPPGERGI